MTDSIAAASFLLQTVHSILYMDFACNHDEVFIFYLVGDDC